jgi:hypothetical protein
MNIRQIILLFLCLISFCVFPAFSQERLVPEGRSSSYEYYERVDDLLLGRGRNKFVFQVRPSFDPETCLFFSDETKELVLREAGKNIWYSEEWYSFSKASKKRRGPNNDFAIKEYRCHVSTRISEKLDSLFMAAVFSSSLMSDSLGLDGITFELRTFWGRYAASCWSPKQDDSNCSRLVCVLKALCGFVKEENVNGIEGLVPEIDALTAIFSDLLPQGGKIVDRETGFLYESR